MKLLQGNTFQNTGLCEENPLVTSGFSSQRASDADFGISFDEQEAGELRCLGAHLTSLWYWILSMMQNREHIAI